MQENLCISKEKNVSIQGSIFNKEWANRQLSFAIRELKDASRRWENRLLVAIYIKNRLRDFGFPWQAERVENWIHRLQPRLADFSEGERPHPGGNAPI